MPTCEVESDTRKGRTPRGLGTRVFELEARMSWEKPSPSSGNVGNAPHFSRRKFFVLLCFQRRKPARRTVTGHGVACREDRRSWRGQVGVGDAEEGRVVRQRRAAKHIRHLRLLARQAGWGVSSRETSPPPRASPQKRARISSVVGFGLLALASRASGVRHGAIR